MLTFEFSNYTSKQSSFLLGFLKSGQKHKEKNPDLKLIASISGLADDLLKDRNITARKLATALDDAQVDGVELNINWNNSQVQKQHLIDFVKVSMNIMNLKSSFSFIVCDELGHKAPEFATIREKLKSVAYNLPF